MEWRGQEDVEPLQGAKDKGLAQAQSSGLYFFISSDPRSHWVHRKSKYYQEGVRCCLMSFLLKVLSDMLQKLSTTFSHPHMIQTKSQTRPHRNLLSGATEFSCHSHCHKTLVISVSPIGISISPRWDCKLSVSLRNISVKPRWAIGPTENAMQTLCFLFVTFRSNRDERIGPTELAWPTLYLSITEIGLTEFV